MTIANNSSKRARRHGQRAALDAVRQRRRQPEAHALRWPASTVSEKAVHARARQVQGRHGHARRALPSAGYLYGAVEVVGLPTDIDKRKGVVAGYRILGSLRYNSATADLQPQGGAAKVSGTGSKKTLTLAVRNAGNTIAPVTGTRAASRARPGPRTRRSRRTRILPGKSVALGLASAEQPARRQLHGYRHAHAGQAEDHDHQEDHGASLSELEALLDAAPVDGRRVRASCARRSPGARAGGDRRAHRRDAARGRAGARRARLAAGARRRCRRRAALERMRALLARVPEPLADLDHVPATAETVLERVRYLHEHYELERCRVLLLGDHDATSLAFARARRAAARAGRRRRRPAPAAASWRATASTRGSPTCASACRRRCASASTSSSPTRRTRPRASACSRRAAIEALKRESPAGSGRLRLSGGLARARAEGPVRALARSSSSTRRVLPDFNAYDGALAIGSRAALYVLRPTKRSRKIAVRRGGRHARGDVHARPPGDRVRRRRAAGSARAGRAGGAVLRRGLARKRSAAADASCSTRRSPRETVYVNLAPDLVYSLYQAAVAAVGRARADRRPQPHRGPAHAPPSRRGCARSSRRATRSSSSPVPGTGAPFTLVELRGDGAPRDERRVYREATSTSIASAASGAPQSSSDAGVATL